MHYCFSNVFAKACLFNTENHILALVDSRITGDISLIFGGPVPENMHPESYLQKNITHDLGFTLPTSQFISYQFSLRRLVDNTDISKYNNYDLFLYYLIFLQPCDIRTQTWSRHRQSTMQFQSHQWITITQAWNQCAKDKLSIPDQEFLAYIAVTHRLLKR